VIVAINSTRLKQSVKFRALGEAMQNFGFGYCYITCDINCRSLHE